MWQRAQPICSNSSPRPASPRRLLGRRRLEVVEQVELEVVDEAASGSRWRRRRCPGRRRRRRPAAPRCVSSAPSSTMPAGVTTRPPRWRPRQVRVDRLQAHLVVERADDELADRDRAAVREERPHAQVGVDALRRREVSTVPSGSAVMRAVVDALARRAACVTARRSPRALGDRAASRIARRSAVISSASISFRPRPNRCGASRLSGRVTTSPPKPAEPRGRPWHAAQLSARPAPIARFVSTIAVPSPASGPWPCRA